MNTCKHLLLRSILTLSCFLLLLASCQQEELAGTSGTLVDVPLHITLRGVQDYSSGLGDAQVLSEVPATSTPMVTNTKFRVLALQRNQIKGRADYNVTTSGVELQGDAMQLALGAYKFVAYSLNTPDPLAVLGSEGILSVTNLMDLLLGEDIEEFRNVGNDPVSLSFIFVPQRAKVQVKIDASALKANVLSPGEVKLDGTFYTGASFSLVGGQFFDYTGGSAGSYSLAFPDVIAETRISTPLYVFPNRSASTVTVKNVKVQGYLPFNGSGSLPPFLPGREYVYTQMMITKRIPLSGANSFMIGEVANYTIDASIKGNGKQVTLPADYDKKYAATAVPENASDVNITGGASAKVLWETDNTATSPVVGSVVKDVSYDSATKQIKFSTTAKEGNALIALYDASGAILWSWHIWRTNETPTAMPLKSVIESKTGVVLAKEGELVVMDRHLGALSAKPQDNRSAGLLYQWGRKDPMPGIAILGSPLTPMATAPVGFPLRPESSGQYSVAESIKQPATFFWHAGDGDWCTTRNDNLWGTAITTQTGSFSQNKGTKTIYDPCPPGWRMPPAYTFANANGTTGGSYDKGYSIDVFTSGKGWFPLSGHWNTLKGELSSAENVVWTGSPQTGGFGCFLYLDPSVVMPSSGHGARSYGASCRCMQE